MKRAFKASDTQTSLFDALIEAQNRFGAGKVIIEDQDRKPLTYGLFITGVFALSRLLKRYLGNEDRIGMMLPTSTGGAASFFALHALARCR